MKKKEDTIEENFDDASDPKEVDDLFDGLTSYE